MKDKIILIQFLALLMAMGHIEVSAQETDDWKVYRPERDSSLLKGNQNPEKLIRTYRTGDVRIIQPNDIAILDSLKRKNPTKPNGYRVQIFFGKRDEAQKVKAEFLKEYPEVGAYISYLAPNFRLRVGDFRTKMACEEFKEKLSDKFSGSYIVRDDIELPPIEEEKAEEKD